MQRIVLNDYIDATMAVIFIMVVLSILVFALRAIAHAQRETVVTVRETLVVWRT